MSLITIVLADDHRVVREGFRALLLAESDFRIVGETGDGLEVLRLVEQLQPRVLVTDLMMTGLNGLDIARRLEQRDSRTRVLILSMHANEAYRLEALRHGAAGYVLKDSSAADLVHAVREVAAGRRYFSPPLSEPVINASLQSSKKTGAFDAHETLTHREREVLHLAAEGHTNAGIAGRLHISQRTVETHRANFMRKLSLRSHTDLIRYALQRGIVPLEANVKRPP